jgi:hypothetical protein
MDLPGNDTVQLVASWRQHGLSMADWRCSQSNGGPLLAKVVLVRIPPFFLEIADEAPFFLPGTAQCYRVNIGPSASMAGQV